MAAVAAVVRSEWTKIRSVRSTGWTLSLAAVVTAGLGVLISLFVNRQFAHMPAAEQIAFDATYTSFAGMAVGQLLMIVFGVLVVSSEYSTGMIRSSLAAVPRRSMLLAAKVAVAGALALLVGLVTAFGSFFLGQSVLGVHRVRIGDPGVLRAVFGCALYMALIAVFAMGIAAMLRGPLLSLAILMPFFFIVSTVLGRVSATRKVAQYLPDQAGQKAMQVVSLADTRPYGPWSGLLIMAGWVAAALAGGFAVLERRDA